MISGWLCGSQGELLQKEFRGLAQVRKRLIDRLALAGSSRFGIVCREATLGSWKQDGGQGDVHSMSIRPRPSFPPSPLRLTRPAGSHGVRTDIQSGSSDFSSFRIGDGSAQASAASRSTHARSGSAIEAGHCVTVVRSGCIVRWKCVNPCATGVNSTCAATAALNRAATCDATSASTAHSRAELHSPPQMPSGGRSFEQDVALALEQQHGHCALRQRRGAGAAPAIRRPARRAARRNRRCTGHSDRSAAARACRSSRRGPSCPACTRRCPASAPRRRTASATRHNSPWTRGSPGHPSTPRWRASTRFTLPSRIAPRSPQANAAIAAAVERPMPGSVASVAASRGKSPPCSRTTACAAACR